MSAEVIVNEAAIPVQQAQPPAARLGSAVGLVLGMGAMLAAGYLLGSRAAVPAARYVVADTGGVVIEAMVERAGELRDAAVAQKQLIDPMQSVLRRYAADGYIVIDAARDGQGGYAVLALPAGARDITAELREVAKLPAAPAAPDRSASAATASPASPAASGARP